MKDIERPEESAEEKADRQYGLVWRIMFATGALISAVEIINAAKG